VELIAVVAKQRNTLHRGSQTKGGATRGKRLSRALEGLLEFVEAEQPQHVGKKHIPTLLRTDSLIWVEFRAAIAEWRNVLHGVS